jgi:hypothetical protein
MSALEGKADIHKHPFKQCEAAVRQESRRTTPGWGAGVSGRAGFLRPTLSLSEAINPTGCLCFLSKSAKAHGRGPGSLRLCVGRRRQSPAMSRHRIGHACPASVDHTTPTVLSDFQTTRARRRPLSIYSANWSGTPVVLGNARRAPVADMLRTVQSMTLRRLLKTIFGRPSGCVCAARLVYLGGCS